MNLFDLSLGQSAKVAQISGSDNIKLRLYELGFYPSSTVSILKTSMRKSMFLVSVNGGAICMRGNVAKLIRLEA